MPESRKGASLSDRMYPINQKSETRHEPKGTGGHTGDVRPLVSTPGHDEAR